MTDTAPEVTDAGEAPDPLAPDENAPYGYTVDRKTGERRPKKIAGRPKTDAEGPDQQTPEEIRNRTPVEKGKDREPGTGLAKGRRGNRPPEAPEDIPAFRAGPIAKGMNRLYLKGGKLIRGFDQEVGQAIIDATKKESEDDVTVGEAWEELARVNPRIRKFLLKLISGGAWGQLFMAHAPILLAVIMKPAIISHIPFAKVIESMAEPEDDTPAGEGALPGGMTGADVGEAMAFAQAQAESMGLSISPDMLAQAAQMVGLGVNGNGTGVPAGVRMPADHQVRNQPRAAGPRAKRRG